MRLLVDYRPALRARTGVGEWVHQLARSILAVQATRVGAPRVDLSLFVSSWKDRPSPEARSELAGAEFLDRRIPVRLLTWLWNRLTWPPVEFVTGRRRFDVTFSPTPLLVPTLAPVRVVTVHDLDFLDHPERTWGEMRRDFPALVRQHVLRADLVTTISHFTAGEAVRRLGIPEDRLVVCRPGVPDWVRAAGPAMGRPYAGTGYILFVGTLEPRKNVLGLLDAYERLAARMPDAPRLVLAGGIPPVAEPLLRPRLTGPLAQRVEARGYLSPEDRPALYAGASMLVLPSFMEGFGLPVLEAMALGIPVIVSNRGALPEVAGDAGIITAPDDSEALAIAMERVLREPNLAQAMRERGLAQAARFDWHQAASHFLDRVAAAVGASSRERGQRP